MGLKTKTKDLAQYANFGADSSATTIISPRTAPIAKPEQVCFLFFPTHRSPFSLLYYLIIDFFNKVPPSHPTRGDHLQ
jgi:hypothetical protein